MMEAWKSTARMHPTGKKIRRLQVQKWLLLLGSIGVVSYVFFIHPLIFDLHALTNDIYFWLNYSEGEFKPSPVIILAIIAAILFPSLYIARDFQERKELDTLKDAFNFVEDRYNLRLLKEKRHHVEYSGFPRGKDACFIELTMHHGGNGMRSSILSRIKIRLLFKEQMLDKISALVHENGFMVKNTVQERNSSRFSMQVTFKFPISRTHGCALRLHSLLQDISNALV